MKKLSLLFIVVILLSLGACTPKVDTEADNTAINTLIELNMKAFNESNPDLMLSLLDKNILIMPPNESTYKGIEGAQEWFKGIKYNSFDITYPADEVQINEDWAFVRGTLKGTMVLIETGESIMINNKGIRIIKKQQDGSWKISHMIFNSNY